VCVDVQGYADRSRTNADLVAVRDGMYGALERAFTRSGVDWQTCYRADRGDGVLIVVPPDVTSDLLVTTVPGELASALQDHNAEHGPHARIQLRMAVHAREVHRDKHGLTSMAINLTSRLLDAEALKRALAGAPGVLAVIASQSFYEEVIQHTVTSHPGTYQRVRVCVKETTATGWIRLPDSAIEGHVAGGGV
jgi:hypothetical protein